MSHFEKEVAYNETGPLVLSIFKMLPLNPRMDNKIDYTNDLVDDLEVSQ